jgi:hypothetical protein
MKKQFYVRLTDAITAIILFAMVIPLLSFAAKPEDDRVKQVKGFVDAFNARNIDAMLNSVEEDIQWLSIDGTKISVEVEGIKPLRKYMEGYFQNCTSCRSELITVRQVGNRVTALERASWTGKTGQKSQASMSVYEFRGNRISRVYYFPVERDQ